MTEGYPTGPRVLAGVGAILATLSFGMVLPGGLMESGYPRTAAVMLATTIPLVAFLVFLALAPSSLQRGLSRVSRVDLRIQGHAGALVLLAGVLYFVLGYGSLTNGMFAFEQEIVRGEEPTPIDGNALLMSMLVSVIVLVIPPLVYVAVVHGKSLRGALEAHGLHERDWMRATFVGFGAALAVLFVIAIVSYAITGLEIEVPENERALEIARSITVLGAFGISVGAAISEEVFFRGFLQPRIGLWGQAVFFSLAHLSYVNVLEVVVTFVLALIFGLIYKRTGNLAAPIAAHFLFNMIMLVAGMYAPDTG